MPLVRFGTPGNYSYVTTEIASGFFVKENSGIDLTLSTVGIVYNTLADALQNTHLAALHKLASQGFSIDTSNPSYSYFNFNSYILGQLHDPVNDQDAVTKNYLTVATFDRSQIRMKNNNCAFGQDTIVTSNGNGDGNTVMGIASFVSLYNSYGNCVFGDHSCTLMSSANNNIIVGKTNFYTNNLTGSRNIFLSVAFDQTLSATDCHVLGSGCVLPASSTGIACIGNDITATENNTMYIAKSNQKVVINGPSLSVAGPVNQTNLPTDIVLGVAPSACEIKWLSNGSDFKECFIRLTAMNGTATINFTIPFTYTPGVGGLAPGMLPSAVTCSPSSVVITTSVPTTGYVRLYGV